jgi:hypothetical protein
MMFPFCSLSTPAVHSFKKTKLLPRHTHLKAPLEKPATSPAIFDVKQREREFDSLTLEKQRKVPISERLAMLHGKERWWRDISYVLERRGYRLRQRYQPDWQASWLTTGEPHWLCEDGKDPKDLVRFWFSQYKSWSINILCSVDTSWMLLGWRTAFASA